MIEIKTPGRGANFKVPTQEQFGAVPQNPHARLQALHPTYKEKKKAHRNVAVENFLGKFGKKTEKLSSNFYQKLAPEIVRPLIKDHLEMATVNINAPDAPDGRKRFLDYFDAEPLVKQHRENVSSMAVQDEEGVTTTQRRMVPLEKEEDGLSKSYLANNGHKTPKVQGGHSGRKTSSFNPFL